MWSLEDCENRTVRCGVVMGVFSLRVSPPNAPLWSALLASQAISTLEVHGARS